MCINTALVDEVFLGEWVDNSETTVVVYKGTEKLSNWMSVVGARFLTVGVRIYRQGRKRQESSLWIWVRSGDLSMN